MNSKTGVHEHSRLIRLLRRIAILALLVAAIARVALFHYHALYRVTFPRYVVAVLPFLFIACAVPIVRRTLFMSIVLLVLATAVIVSGALDDYRHFLHCDRDPRYCGLHFYGTVFDALGGVTLLFLFRLAYSNATVA